MARSHFYRFVKRLSIIFMYKPGFFKRLLVAIYDGFLMIAVLIVTSAILMALFTAVAPADFFVDPSNFDQTKIATLSNSGRAAGGLIVSINCIALSFLYYAWFWTHGGQTVGMRAWNLYLVNEDGKFINWKVALIRYLSAIVSWTALGLGFTWLLLNPERRTWHDSWSASQIIYVPKAQQPGR